MMPNLNEMRVFVRATIETFIEGSLRRIPKGKLKRRFKRSVIVENTQA